MEDIIKSYKNIDFGAVNFKHLNILNTRSRVRIPQNAASVFAFIFPYGNKKAFGGNISCYCAVQDYHIIVIQQLKSICEKLQNKYPQHSFVPFCDASPIDEVDMAVKAGLGVKGKNSLLITKKWGSFVFIGEIVTDLEYNCTLKEYSFCSGCNLCVKSCPGSAIKDGAVDREKCASFISQKKQELTEEQYGILKKAHTVFGCDICQNVCPHNKNIILDDNLFSNDIINIILNDDIEKIYKDRAFGFRGLNVLKRNLDIYNGSEKE